MVDDTPEKIARELLTVDDAKFNDARMIQGALAIAAYGEQCRRAGAGAMREAAAKVLENGSFLHDKSPSAIWAKQTAALIRALPLPSAGEPASPAAGWRVPDGWKLVPVIPTEAMIEAGWIDKEDVDPDNIYCAMLEAAPSPSEEARAG